MVSIRQEKFSKLIQKELAEIFLKEGKKYSGNIIIGITKVVSSPDLGLSKVYVSFLNTEKHDLVLKQLQDQTAAIRKSLGYKIRNKVRRIPELLFYYDDTMDYVEKMEGIFRNIKKEEEE
jgi:ribosome-binding factor A